MGRYIATISSRTIVPAPDRRATYQVNAMLDLDAIGHKTRSFHAMDVLTGVQWVLSRFAEPVYVSALASPDGKRVAATVEGKLLVWTLDLPTTPQATKRWLDRLTNAVVHADGSVGY